MCCAVGAEDAEVDGGVQRVRDLIIGEGWSLARREMGCESL